MAERKVYLRGAGGNDPADATKDDNMTNLVNISELSDAVFDVYMEAKADPDACVVVEHLTKTELDQLCKAMGWKPSLALALWKMSTDERVEKETGPCYHDKIMARQERESGEW